MQEIFFTIISIWFLYRIFGGSSSYTEQRHSQPAQQQQHFRAESGSDNNGQRPKVGEYVDYEEVG